jgi:hypothetical protein
MTNSGEPVQIALPVVSFSVLSSQFSVVVGKRNPYKFASSNSVLLKNRAELNAAQNRQKRWRRPRVGTRKRDPASFFLEDGIFFPVCGTLNRSCRMGNILKGRLDFCSLFSWAPISPELLNFTLLAWPKL